MAANNFKAFAIGAGSNVTSQADYEALDALLAGFQSGKASSAQINKALRQSTTIAAVLAQFIANNSGNDVLDNGGISTILSNLSLALKANYLSSLPNYYVDTGSSNNIVINPNPPVNVLTEGMRFDISCAAANTGPVTLKVNNQNTYAVLGSAGQLQGGEIAAAKGLISVIWSPANAAFLLVEQNTFGPLPVAPGARSNHAVNLFQLQSRPANLQRFSASSQFTVPAGVFTLYASGCGAGAGGGGSQTSVNATVAGSGGGSAGGFLIRVPIAVTPGDVLSINIGQGGVGGAAGGGTGNPGGATTISRSGSILVNLSGGIGGSVGQSSASSASGGAPGNSPGSVSGGWGGDSQSVEGGGAYGGMGGPSPFGAHGAQVRGNNNPIAGINATGNGAGGGGAGGSNVNGAHTGAKGGDGANGLMIIEW